MTISHNQQLVKNHFRKDWQRRVRNHFDQPVRKLRRRNARLAKAVKVAPRPVDRLRPIVRCPTIKYNRRIRSGRGFSLAELKEAGIPRRYAPTVGIAVDPRRANLSVESLKVNVERLKAYQERLIVFPRRAGKAKAGDASKSDAQKASGTDAKIVRHLGDVLPIVNRRPEDGVSQIKKSDLPKGEEAAYVRLRRVRSDARYKGVREKRAAAKAEAEAQKAK